MLIAENTGKSFIGVIVILLVKLPELVAAPAPSEFASVTTQLRVRPLAVIVGSSLVK